MRRGAVRAFFSERRGGRSMMRSAIPYHPVCADKEREHFLSGAATPPNLGGEFGLTYRYMTYLWAKRELEDIDALLLTKSSGKCPNSREASHQTNESSESSEARPFFGIR